MWLDSEFRGTCTDGVVHRSKHEGPVGVAMRNPSPDLTRKKNLVHFQSHTDAPDTRNVDPRSWTLAAPRLVYRAGPSCKRTRTFVHALGHVLSSPLTGQHLETRGIAAHGLSAHCRSQAIHAGVFSVSWLSRICPALSLTRGVLLPASPSIDKTVGRRSVSVTRTNRVPDAIRPPLHSQSKLKRCLVFLDFLVNESFGHQSSEELPAVSFTCPRRSAVGVDFMKFGVWQMEHFR